MFKSSGAARFTGGMIFAALVTTLSAGSVGTAYAAPSTRLITREAEVEADATEHTYPVPGHGFKVECRNPNTPDEKRAPASPPAEPDWNAPYVPVSSPSATRSRLLTGCLNPVA